MNRRLHRTDGPAIEWTDGSKFWYVNGKRHRVDGPAVDLSNGPKEWWFNGVKTSPEEIIERTGIVDLDNLTDVDLVILALTY